MSKENSQIFVIKTSPKTVLKDYAKLMHMADYEKKLNKKQKIILKLNLSLAPS